MAKQPYGVLVIHGFTSSLDCVSGIEASLKALGLPTRMPVLRGHSAESPEALRGVTWPDWVADADAALKDLLTEAERAIVFGHSMGGLAALTLAAAAVQLTSPLAPGQPFHFLVPVLRRILKKWDVPPTYADPELVQYDTNYAWAPMDAIVSFLEFGEATRHRLPEVQVPALIMQSRKDTTVAPGSAEIIYDSISTPADQKRIVWFEVTEHEMFRDCERESTTRIVVDYVRDRTGLSG